MTIEDLISVAQDNKAWPFEEARKIVKRLERKKDRKRPVIFETGYGPSGLPHIGTFGEVARTSMVRHAFHVLTDHSIETKLICFSDDMDGLRKVPDNVPNKELVQKDLNKPLTEVADPFGTHDSFGRHNNARLQSFLDQFGFEYEFASSTDYYTSGKFDDMLTRVLERYDAIMDIMLPTLREERRATYSPFLPICPRTRHVLQVPIINVDLTSKTITYRDPETNEEISTEVTGGKCKLQWKPDWAMRWAALGVDYEMSGKDLIDSVKQGNRICKALGAQPPEGFNYELFLDEKGEKISKSKGNGLSIEEWLTYASAESLSLFMYQAPRKAKRLYFDVIPKNVDEYFTHLGNYTDQEAKQKLGNPVWHIHSGQIPDQNIPISFSMLLNLVSASNAQDKDVLWGFISRYAPGTTAENNPKLDELVGYAVRYFKDFVEPNKQFRAPTEQERAALQDLDQRLDGIDATATGEEIQNLVYAVGKEHEFENLRDWFKALYEVLLGQSQGPRFGSFAALYGINETREMIQKGLSGELGV